MCLKHFLKPKAETESNTLTPEEYEKLYSEFEKKVIETKGEYYDQVDEEHRKSNRKGFSLADNCRSLEIELLTEYNLPLLYYLCSLPRRQAFLRIVYEKYPPFYITRGLGALCLSGDYTTKEIRTILRLFYNTGQKLGSWELKTVEYKTFGEFLSIIYDIAIQQCSMDPKNGSNGIFLLDEKYSIYKDYETIYEALKRRYTKYENEEEKAVSSKKYFEIIKEFEDIHAENEFILRWACFYGYFDIVKYVVEKGADIKAKNYSAIKYACYDPVLTQYFGRKLDIIKYLVEKVGTISDELFVWIVKRYYSHTELITFLLEKGANIHAENEYALKLSCTKDNYFLEEYLTLFKLCEKYGADIHIENNIVLLLACKHNKIEIVKYLIEEKGFEKHKDCFSFACGGEYPREAVTEYLVKNGFEYSDKMKELLKDGSWHVRKYLEELKTKLELN